MSHCDTRYRSEEISPGELMLIHTELGSGGHISCDSAPDYPNSTTSTTSTHPTYLVTRSTCAEPGGKRAEEKLAKEEKSRKSGGKKGHFITGRALPPRWHWTRPEKARPANKKWTRPKLTPAPSCRRRLKTLFFVLTEIFQSCLPANYKSCVKLHYEWVSCMS